MTKKIKLLITGGAGYIGSHTIKELCSAGFKDIVVVDDLSKGSANRLPQNVTFIKGDFADPKVLEKAFSSGIDAVMHFAASKIAPESVIDPAKYYDNNVAKSIILLNFCVEKKVKYFIFSSSAAVYGDINSSPITEEFDTSPVNPYGWSKLMIERALLDFSAAYPLKHVSLRYFNAGGADPSAAIGNDHASGEDVISILMTSANKKEGFTIFGTDYNTKDGTCVRDLVHVSDLARAHIDALKYLLKGGNSITVNLGSEEGFTIREIVNIVKEITGSDFKILEGEKRQGDIEVSIASSERAAEFLGWKREHSGIRDIVTTAWNWEKKTHITN